MCVSITLSGQDLEDDGVQSEADVMFIPDEVS